MGGAITALLLNLAGLAPSAYAQTSRGRDLTDLSLIELANLEITSVARHDERLADAPASLFVITADDNRRSGAVRAPARLDRDVITPSGTVAGGPNFLHNWDKLRDRSTSCSQTL